MKIKCKLIFICLIFSFNAGIVLADGTSELYILKKTQINSAAPIVHEFLKSQNYKVFGSTNMYITQDNANDVIPKFHIIIFKQNKNDCYYYNYTNDNYVLNDMVLGEFKKNNIKYTSKNNRDLKDFFEAEAIDLKDKAENSNANMSYDFSDEAQQKFENTYFGKVSVENGAASTLQKKSNDKDFNAPNRVQTNQLKSTPNTLNGNIIPAGTILNVNLQSDISTASLSSNDRITASLSGDLIYNGVVVAPAGSVIYGKTLNAKKAGYAYGNSSVEILFDEILTPDGQLYNISAEKVRLATKTNRAGKITRDIAVGTVVGVAGGLVAALFGVDIKNALIWGAGSGAFSGTMHAAFQRGDNVEISGKQNIKIKLTQPLSISH